MEWRAGLASRDARGEEGEERGLGSRAVTRVVLVAKGGIHEAQRERRARAGPALHWPPLITFSGPLPAGTDNAGGAFEVPKRCRGGSLLNPPPHPPPSSGGGGRGPAGQNPEPVAAGPKRMRQRENKQVWSQAHGAVSVPRPAEQG